jgi:hypothetical protein
MASRIWPVTIDGADNATRYHESRVQHIKTDQCMCNATRSIVIMSSKTKKIGPPDAALIRETDLSLSLQVSLVLEYSHLLFHRPSCSNILLTPVLKNP